jgi:hypothetical protein
MKSLLDKSFVYRDSTSTDLRRTFARVRRELAKAAKPPPVESLDKVSPIFERQRRAK